MAHYHNSQHIGNRVLGKYEALSASSNQEFVSVSVDPEIDFDLSGIGRSKPLLSGTIHPFQKRQSRIYEQMQTAVKPMLTLRSARRAFAFILLNMAVIFVMFMWCGSTNSIALQAFTYLSIFDLLTLLTCIASLWNVTNCKSDQAMLLFSFERIEILLVFASVVLAMLSSIFIFKECFSRSIDQPEVTIGRLIPGAMLGFVFHIFKSFSVKNKAFQSVHEASTSSIIQEHISDMSRGLCAAVPSLSKLLLPRIDPFLIIFSLASVFISLANIFIQLDSYFFADTVAAFLIACCTLCTMLPVASCSARVLLNTIPPYIICQLDKLLSEAQTLEGVLEIRNERFHTVALCNPRGSEHKRHSNSFGLILAGTMVVRVGRDTNAQTVLSLVVNHLSPLVTHLTVQVVKDAPVAVGSGQPLTSSKAIAVGGTDNSKLAGSKLATSVSNSSLLDGFNKPAAAVAPYQQKLTFNPQHPSVSKPSQSDDFSFSSPSVSAFASESKPASSPSAAANIARMYRAAGFTSPPAPRDSVHDGKLIGNTRSSNTLPVLKTGSRSNSSYNNVIINNNHNVSSTDQYR